MKARISFCLTCLFVLSSILALFGSAHRPTARAQDEDTNLFGVAWSPDGKWISATSTNGLWLYNAEIIERAPSHYFEGHIIPVAAFDPLRDRMAVYDETTRQIHIIEPATGEIIVDIPGAVEDYDFAYEMAYSHDGKLLVVGFDSALKIYDAITSRGRATYDSTGIYSVDSPDPITQPGIFIAGGFAGSILTYDMAEDTFASSSFELADETAFESIYQLVLLPNTTEGLALRGDSLMRFDLADQTSSLFDPTIEYVGGFGLNHTGDILVVGMEGKVVFYDPTTVTVIHEVATDEDATVFSVAFSPDDSQMVTLDTAGKIHIWDVAEGRITVRWNGFTRAYRPSGG